MIKTTLSETNVFAPFCLVMLKTHVGNKCFCTVLFSGYDLKAYRKPMFLHRLVWLGSKNMSETNVLAEFFCGYALKRQ
jgi:hypothetical protein